MHDPELLGKGLMSFIYDKIDLALAEKAHASRPVTTEFPHAKLDKDLLKERGLGGGELNKLEPQKTAWVFLYLRLRLHLHLHAMDFSPII